MPAEKVYENDHTFAFLDISPNNFGHTLVLPKKHYENIFDMPTSAVHEVYETAQKIARALQATGVEGINIISNNNATAGQVIFHAHVHVIPREADDGFTYWPQKKYNDYKQMREIGEKIRRALA
jgi:histidine triad (HIT) family protein